jgi:hypothetical protein
MTRDDFNKAQYKLSAQAGLNQRYHQRQANRWWWADAEAKILTAIFAVLGLGLSLAGWLTDNPSIDGCAVIVSFLAAVGAIVLNVIPFGLWEREAVDRFRRWTDLREEADQLRLELGDSEPSPEFSRRLASGIAKAQQICGSETLADKKLLDECQEAEEVSRGCEPSTDASKAKPVRHWWPLFARGGLLNR